MANYKTAFAFIFVILLFCRCEKPNNPPLATLTVSPASGNTTIIFDLDASYSSDKESIPQLLEFRWDFDGDGNWDTPYRKGPISAFQFDEPGEYTLIVEVMDPTGLTATAQSQIVITSLKSFVDERDGQEYPMVLFGNTWWMGANLDYGETIPPGMDQENNGIIEKYQYQNTNYPELAGGLYQWEEAMDYAKLEGSRGICPEGWHIPTDHDWKNLLSHFTDPVDIRIPDYTIENNKFIPDQTVHHNNYQAEGAIWKLLKSTGRTGLDVVMQGYRNPDGDFDNKDYHFSGETASFWTSSKYGNYGIRSRFYKNGTNGEIFRFWDNTKYGFSIRCIKRSD